MPDEPEAAGTETVAVYTRVRAGLEGEDEIMVMDDPTKIRARNLEFNLDRCFSQKASQEDVYGVVGEKLVERVVDGYNAAILAYGQTGSGKVCTASKDIRTTRARPHPKGPRTQS